MVVISRIHQLRCLKTVNAARVRDGDPCIDVAFPPKRDSYAPRYDSDQTVRRRTPVINTKVPMFRSVSVRWGTISYHSL
jgi:hypothetical protein